jgi:hypothetical protein
MRLALAAVLIVGIGYGVYSMTIGKAKEPEAKPAAATTTKQQKGWASDAAAKTKGLLASIGGEEEEPQPDAMVACQRNGNTVYMHEGDCVNQGGRVLFRRK